MTHATEAAAIIAKFNPTLAEMFTAQPFYRIQYAKAFRAGFGGEQSAEAILLCKLVLNLSTLDQYDRQRPALLEACAQADANVASAVRALLEA